MTDSGKPPHDLTKADLASLLTVIALLMLGATLQLSISVNHDAAWVLYGSERLADGGVFGRDVIDVNPPLAWWIDLPAVYGHKVTGLPLAFVFKVYVIVLLAISLACCSSFLSELNRLDRARYLFTASVICLFTAGYDFGQREFLMAVLCQPYILLIVHRVRTKAENKQHPLNRSAIALASFLGAIAFCIKPHFLAIPIGLELWLQLHSRASQRLFRIETVALCAGGAAYVALVWTLAPEWVQRVAPQAVSNYGAYSTTLSDVFAKHGTAVLSPIAALLALRLWAKRAIDESVVGFVVAGTAAFIAAISQLKGWHYHILPAIVFWSIAGVIGVLNCLNRHQPVGRISPGIPWVLAGVISLAVVTPTLQLIQDRSSKTGNETMVRSLAQLIQDRPTAERTVFAFNTSPRVIHSAIVASDARWTGNACCLHFLPSHIREPENQKRRETAFAQTDDVMSMLEARQPAILIVDEGRTKLAFGNAKFDYIAWFADNYPQRFPRFIAQYERSHSVGYFGVYLFRSL